MTISRSIALTPCLLFLTTCHQTNSGTVFTTATPEEIAKIQEYLEPFVRVENWVGDRWKVTGMSRGYPVTESIGPWEISVMRSEKGGILDLPGIRIGKACAVELDTNQGVLFIEGTPFVGRSLTGKSPIVRDAPFRGAVFESSQLGISGSAAILVLEDGRLLFDFHKVRMNGSRGEYGLLSPKRSEAAR